MGNIESAEAGGDEAVLGREKTKLDSNDTSLGPLSIPILRTNMKGM